MGQKGVMGRDMGQGTSREAAVTYIASSGSSQRNRPVYVRTSKRLSMNAVFVYSEIFAYVIQMRKNKLYKM